MEGVFERASSSDILVQERRFNYYMYLLSILPGDLANDLGGTPIVTMHNHAVDHRSTQREGRCPGSAT